MSTQTGDIFGSTSSADSTQSTQTSSVPSTFEDHLKAIKNERGEQKYENLEKALEALKVSQEFIPTLKSQLAEKDEEIKRLKEIADKAASVEDLVSRLTSSPEKQTTPASTFDEQKAAALFKQMMERTNSDQIRKSNLQAVTSNLVNRFGSPDTALKAIKEKAESLGTTSEALRTLAADNPNLVLALFPEATKGSPSPAGVNTAGFMGRQPDTELKRPEKSLLAGATYKDQVEFLRQIRQDVYKKHGIDN